MSVDLVSLFDSFMEEKFRPYDALLHPSSDLSDHLRHVQLKHAQASVLDDNLISMTIAEKARLMTGTFWHTHFEEAIKAAGIPGMTEVDLTPGLPPGWSGRADLLLWEPSLNAFRLWDFKSTKGESIPYIVRDGAKDDHKRQTSAYWIAAYNMGFPMVQEISILYWPINPVVNNANIKPEIVSFEPLKSVFNEMVEITPKVLKYVHDFKTTGDFDQPSLADPPPRVQTLKKKGEIYEIILAPDWRAPYCPAGGDESLCPCGKYGTTKVAEYDPNTQHLSMRKGYETIKPSVDILKKLRSMGYEED